MLYTVQLRALDSKIHLHLNQSKRLPPGPAKDPAASIQQSSSSKAQRKHVACKIDLPVGIVGAAGVTLTHPRPPAWMKHLSWCKQLQVMGGYETVARISWRVIVIC